SVWVQKGSISMSTSDTAKSDGELDSRKPRSKKVRSRMPTTVGQKKVLMPVDVLIKGSYEKFTKEQCSKFVSAFASLLEATEEVRVIQERSGSIILTLALSPVQYERLKLALVAGDLEKLRVLRLRRSRRPEDHAAIAALVDEGRASRVSGRGVPTVRRAS